MATVRGLTPYTVYDMAVVWDTSRETEGRTGEDGGGHRLALVYKYVARVGLPDFGCT